MTLRRRNYTRGAYVVRVNPYAVESETPVTRYIISSFENNGVRASEIPPIVSTLAIGVIGSIIGGLIVYNMTKR